MKRLEVIDRFDCTIEEFWANFFDPAFVARLDAELGFAGREELLFHEDEQKIQTRCRITPRKELPPHIQQMLQNGVKMLQQVVSSGTAVQDMPESMRKMVEWGRSTFKDFLGRPGKTESPAQIKLTYLEEGTFDKTEKILRWTITPDVFKDVSSFKGTIRVEPVDDGCQRTIEGEMHLGVPGAGEKIEQFLVDEVSRNHSKAAEMTRKAILERRGVQTP